MKTISRAFTLAITFGWMVSTCAWAQEKESINSQASEQGFEQQAIRAEIISLHDRLKNIRKELAENGAPVSDLAAIDGALAKLESVSEEKMQAVIVSLKNAGQAVDSNAVRAALLSAYVDQGKVIGGMLSFSDDIRLKQTLLELRDKTQDLLLRQTENLRQTVSLKDTGGSTKVSDGTKRIQQTIASTSQDILSREILSVAESIKQAAADPENPDSRALGTCVVVVDKWNFPAETQAATKAVSKSEWGTAVPSQQKLRDGLQEILFSLQSVMTVEDKLEAMMNDLTALADAQRGLAEKPDASEERKQEGLEDAASILEKGLLAVNIKASEKTKLARDLMNKAKAEMGKKSPETTATQQKAADALAEAKEELKTQLASLPDNAAPETLQDKMAVLGQLLDEVTKQKEEADKMAADSKATTASAQDLSKKVADTQSKAVAVSPPAAQPLGAAATQLNSPDATASDQARSASPELAKAADALRGEMDQVRKDIENAEKMAQAQDALDAASLQTDLGERSTKGDSADMEEAASRFDNAAQRLASMDNPGSLSPEAGKAVDEAKSALGEAKDAAEKGSAQDAQSAADKAQAALGKAKEAMNVPGGKPSMMAGKDGKPGKPGPPMPTKSGGGKNHGPEPLPDQLFGSGADTRRNAGVVVGALKPAERAAIQQSAKENVPDEYTALIRQYTKNIADQGTTK